MCCHGMIDRIAGTGRDEARPSRMRSIARRGRDEARPSRETHGRDEARPSRETT